MTCKEVYYLVRTMVELMIALRIPHPDNQQKFFNWRIEENPRIRRFKYLLTDTATIFTLYCGLWICLETKRFEEIKKPDK